MSQEADICDIFVKRVDCDDILPYVKVSENWVCFDYQLASLLLPICRFMSDLT